MSTFDPVIPTSVLITKGYINFVIKVHYYILVSLRLVETRNAFMVATVVSLNNVMYQFNSICINTPKFHPFAAAKKMSATYMHIRPALELQLK